MSFCVKCGAYIPMEETVCPACGYDPDAEAKKAAEAARQAEARRAEEQRRAEEAQRRTYSTGSTASAGSYQTRSSSGSYRTHSSSGTYRARSSSGGYTSSHSGTAGTRNGETPGTMESGSTGEQYRRAYARDSVEHQRLSILSYIGLLFLIPYFTRKDDEFARFHANQGLCLFIFEILINVLTGIFSGGLSSLISVTGNIITLICIVRGIRSVCNGRMDPLPIIGGFEILK